MGYTITIGNAIPVHSKEDGELYASWEVEFTRQSDAPTFPNDPSENTNTRSPAYSVWEDFGTETGLYDLFFDKEIGLLREHPGCFLIESRHLTMVKNARESWQTRALFPPGFEGFPEFDEKRQQWITPDAGKYDASLARLLWLDWWMHWAVANCETPGIQNG